MKKKLPTKIYLRERELEHNYSGNMLVSCDKQFDDCVVEYTNLDRLWRDADKAPKEFPILCQDENNKIWVRSNFFLYDSEWSDFIKREKIVRYAYLWNFVPKGGKK